MTSAIKVKRGMSKQRVGPGLRPRQAERARLRRLSCESSRPAITAVLHDKRKMERY